jgi:hypothetical protein
VHAYCSCTESELYVRKPDLETMRAHLNGVVMQMNTKGPAGQIGKMIKLFAIIMK